jgi:hypothetical protein
MIERRYWDVIANASEHGQTRRVRSIIPAQRLSRMDAESMAKEHAKRHFADSHYAIQSTRLVEAWFWRITFEPPTPITDGSVFFDVCTQSGEIVEMFSLNEDVEGASSSESAH